jgi:hypothetical protein
MKNIDSYFTYLRDNVFGSEQDHEYIDLISAELKQREIEIDRLIIALEKQVKRTEVWKAQVYAQWGEVRELRRSFERLSGKCYEELEALAEGE